VLRSEPDKQATNTTNWQRERTHRSAVSHPLPVLFGRTRLPLSLVHVSLATDVTFPSGAFLLKIQNAAVFVACDRRFVSTLCGIMITTVVPWALWSVFPFHHVHSVTRVSRGHASRKETERFGSTLIVNFSELRCDLLAWCG